jgi:hypothetical protein
MVRQRVESSHSHICRSSFSDAGYYFDLIQIQFAVACSALYNRSPIESQVACGVPEVEIPGTIPGNGTSGGRP